MRVLIIDWPNRKAYQTATVSKAADANKLIAAVVLNAVKSSGFVLIPYST